MTYRLRSNDTLLDDTWKGIPGGRHDLPLAAVGGQRWNILREALPLPVALLKQSALKHNLEWMRRWTRANGVAHAPHGKTLVSPEIFQLYLDAGAWGLTVALPHQLQVARHFGVTRILMANQLVGRSAIAYVLDQLAASPDFEFWTLVDSVDGVRALAEAAAARNIGRPLDLLVEVGFHGGRAGCRDIAAAMAVARAVKAAEPYLRLAGVETYEGVIDEGSTEANAAASARLCDFAVAVAEAAHGEHLFGVDQVLLCAGGSSYFDVVTDRLKRARLTPPPLVVIRSSAYVYHDHGWYDAEFAGTARRVAELAPPNGPRPALEICAYLQSRPEPTKAIIGSGRRESSFAYGMPRPLWWFRPGVHDVPQPLSSAHRLTRLNDHHGFLDLPADSLLRFGDLIGLGVSLPPAVFDRWRLIYLVDDDYSVIGAVQNYS